MIDWLKSWSRTTWLMVWAMVILTAVLVVYLLGGDVFVRWVEALWHRGPGA